MTLTRAQSLRSRLLDLSREADRKREEEKRPHLEAGKAVDQKWMSVVRMAKDAADGIRRAMEAWETIKLTRRRDEERKAEETAKPIEQVAKVSGSRARYCPAGADAARN